MAVITELPTLVAGNDYIADVTLTKDGATYDVTGATVTCTIAPAEHPWNKLIADHAVTLVTAASGIVRLTLTDTETAALRTATSPATTALYHADFKVVESGGDIHHSALFAIPVRRAVT